MSAFLESSRFTVRAVDFTARAHSRRHGVYETNPALLTTSSACGWQRALRFVFFSTQCGLNDRAPCLMWSRCKHHAIIPAFGPASRERFDRASGWLPKRAKRRIELANFWRTQARKSETEYPRAEAGLRGSGRLKGQHRYVMAFLFRQCLDAHPGMCDVFCSGQVQPELRGGARAGQDPRMRIRLRQPRRDGPGAGVRRGPLSHHLCQPVQGRGRLGTCPRR